MSCCRKARGCCASSTRPDTASGKHEAGAKARRQKDAARAGEGRHPCGEDRGRTAARPQGLQIPLRGRGKDHGIGGQTAAHAVAPQGPRRGRRSRTAPREGRHRGCAWPPRARRREDESRQRRNGPREPHGRLQCREDDRKRQNERPDRKRNRRGARPANGRPARGCARRHGPNAKTAALTANAKGAGIGDGADSQVDGSAGGKNVTPQQLREKELNGVEHPLETAADERAGLETGKDRVSRNDVDHERGCPQTETPRETLRRAGADGPRPDRRPRRGAHR